jgi:ribosomal-protein-alanine N-acetyltransferase
VALEGDAVIGYADAWFVCDECTLNRIAFSKKNLRTGNGSLMLKFVLDKALCRGVEKFFLEVRATNTAALLFYKKAGFIQVGLRKEYYSDTSDNAVLMSLIVRNHVQAFRNDR